MTDLSTRVAAEVPRALDDIVQLVSIPSVSSMAEHQGDVQRTADAVADLLREAGCPEVQILRAGGQPAVVGRWPAPAGAPTVCLYAHHDVQPVGDASVWQTPGFEATVRGDRMYGRGAADDKGGIGVHLAALRAFDGTPPVGVTVFVEGEEEIGSPSLKQFIASYTDLLRADAYVICDSGNWDVGQPSFTTTLRGVCDCVVEVATLDHAVHSGQFGGIVPDALTALCRLLATLHDEDGSVAVAGLHHAEAPDLEYPEGRLKAESGVLDGVSYLGTGSVVERVWSKPAITVIGIDAPSVAVASNTLFPSARAKVSLRVAPGQRAEEALDRLVEHLESHAPWGARVTVTRGSAGDPSSLSLEGPVADAARTAFAEAYGVQPVAIGQGGSIPMAAEFQTVYPNATVLLTAVCDPDSRMHGPNESLHLGDFSKAALAEALLLQRLAH
ncbi:MAG TPA: dipeptidase [Propionibacteriaceae bacterium]|nr:dipeptidase [Propionibacteriaceae bacterium]